MLKLMYVHVYLLMQVFYYEKYIAVVFEGYN